MQTCIQNKVASKNIEEKKYKNIENKIDTCKNVL